MDSDILVVPAHGLDAKTMVDNTFPHTCTLLSKPETGRSANGSSGNMGTVIRFSTQTYAYDNFAGVWHQDAFIKSLAYKM